MWPALMRPKASFMGKGGMWREVRGGLIDSFVPDGVVHLGTQALADLASWIEGAVLGAVGGMAVSQVRLLLGIPKLSAGMGVPRRWTS
eukprot:scaffold83273_cov30-Tisochrysis_lutea.AAC.3